MSDVDGVDAGERGRWRWVVSSGIILGLDRALARNFAGKRLCVTSFDSGPLRPNREELAAGWSLVDDIACSPPMTPGFDVPSGGFDEWYVLEDVPVRWTTEEAFVNYYGFTLSTSLESPAYSEGRSRNDWLPTMQERFWRNLDVLEPIIYISSGSSDIVVSTDKRFVDEFERIARSGRDWLS